MMKDYFKLQENHTTVSTEFWGGMSSFLAAFYIIIVNPSILSQAGLSFSAVSTATVLIAAFSTILMGLYANNPIVLAPGMGMNAFFTFSVILGKKIPVDVALGIVFWSGALFLVLSMLSVREKVVALIPLPIRHAVACGIGLFIALIGFMKGGVIVSSPATMVAMAPFSVVTVAFFVALFLSALLVIKNVKGGLVLGILLTFCLILPLGHYWWGETELVKAAGISISWNGFWAWPDFSMLGHINFKDSLALSLWPIIFSFMFTDLFDTISTLVGVFDAGKLLDANGQPRNFKKSLIVDAVATMGSALLGTSPTTSFIESAAGVQQGARTGLSSVFAGLMFLPFLFLSPLLSMFPAFTTAPALVIVGVFMMAPVLKIEWEKMEIALPCFLAMILIPFSFSITQGIVAGMLAWYVLKGLKAIRP